MLDSQDDQAEVLSAHAAKLLREKIIGGSIVSGMPLREAVLASELGVSRNTLREAFRELLSQGLIEHQLYRGVMVKVLGPAELHEIYAIRRTLELAAIDESGFATSEQLDAMTSCVESIEADAAVGNFAAASTGGLKFHRAIVSMLNSRRFDELFEVVSAQLRLAFSIGHTDEEFQKPWIARDRELLDLIVSGRRVEAKRAAASYLQESERLVMDAFRFSASVAEKTTRKSKGSKAGQKGETMTGERSNG